MDEILERRTMNKGRQVLNMLVRGDLHIHSTASDGDLSPGEIVLSAKRQGIDIIAIADHNSTGGIYSAAAAGRQFGVAVVPAVELSAKYKGEPVHILGYFRDTRFYNYTFQEILRLVKGHKINAVRIILSSFMHTSTSGDHLSVPEGITLLKSYGAAVVLAHPVRISTENLRELLKLPFDGIEAKYCSSSPYDTRFFINTALSKSLFYTGGSDFHTDKGGYKTHCSLGNPSLNQMEIQMFLRNSGALVFN